jgi:hypothetical protein
MSMSSNESGVEHHDLDPSSARTFDVDRAENPTRGGLASVRPASVSAPTDGGSPGQPIATEVDAERKGALRLQELLDRTRQLQETNSL